MPKSRIAIVGLGLVGTSLGLALKKNKIDAEIVGHDKDTAAAHAAQKRGAVDKTEWNLHNACDRASLVVLALPLDGVKSTLEALRDSLAPGTIVTDTATTKVPVLEWAKGLQEGVEFVGGNPALNPRRMGTGRGTEAADADLFQDATYALVASPTTASSAIETMANFASLVGAKPYFIDAAEHDGLTAGVEHLPALLAVALQAATMKSQGWHELGKLAGADLRTATEVAPRDAKTAREQFLAHREDLLRWIDLVQEHLRDLRGMVEREDAKAIETLVDSLATERLRWLSGVQDESAPKTDLSAAQNSIGRLFLGGLADRGRKPR